MPKHHILIICLDRYLIVGPFDCHWDALEWGRDNIRLSEPGIKGGQCWRILTLEDATAAPVVLAPDVAVSVIAETV